MKHLLLTISFLLSIVFANSQCPDTILEFARSKTENLAYSTMKNISPNTGLSSKGKITDCYYDNLNGVYTIKTYIVWDAKRYSNIFTSYYKAEVWAEYSFSKNDFHSIELTINRMNDHATNCADSHWADNLPALALTIANSSMN